jgi:uncharacterized membrane protein
MFTLGFLGLKLQPALINSILASQGLDASQFVAESMARRFAYIGGLLTLLAILVPTLSFLFSDHRSMDAAENNPDQTENSFILHAKRSAFILLLILLGTMLVLGIDFIYLRDQFGYRINSVFKFYYEAWILFSLAAAYGTVVLLRNLRRAANGVFSVIFALVVIVGLTYPMLGVFNKTNNFKPPFGFTLDDFDRVQRENPDEAAAMTWLRSAPDGVIAEAIGGQYSAYARISIYTGLPTVLGWPGHEGQWRDTSLQGSRQQDIETLYSATDWVTTQDIINRYNIRYILVGSLERNSYRVNEEKFNNFLKPVFQQGNITVYEVP